jgi:dTDP-4-amino-4,6-dideoxygalactose transaminase
MKHEVSKSDLEFRAAFEAGAYAPADFSHRAHVRLAYVYLATNDVERASTLMRNAIVNFLRHHGIAPTKYHETLTHAWILAVFHFMHRTTEAMSAEDFINRTPILLDSRIMMTHYSAERLFSQHARAAFLEPDLDPIPRHHAA